MGVDTPHVALAALNPHAGEGGLMGREEIEILRPAVGRAKTDGVNVSGPVPADAGSWVGCRLDQARPYGWGLLVEGSIGHVDVGPAQDPLVYFRGRYRELR